MLILICFAVHKLRSIVLNKYQIVYSIKESCFEEKTKILSNMLPSLVHVLHLFHGIVISNDNL